MGVLLRKTLKKVNPLIGNLYVFTRIFEALILLTILSSVFSDTQFSLDLGYFLGMLVLGLGSVPMCLTLLKHNIIPSWLAKWGVIGYALLALGFLLEFFNIHASMYLLIVGGLWELTFGIWLLIKG
jgi:hypothetical protein